MRRGATSVQKGRYILTPQRRALQQARDAALDSDVLRYDVRAMDGANGVRNLYFTEPVAGGDRP